MFKLRNSRHIKNLRASSASWWLSTNLSNSSTALILTPDLQKAEELSRDLRFFASHLKIQMLPCWDTLPFELANPQPEISAKRCKIISELDNNNTGVLISPIQNLLQKILPPKILLKQKIRLKTGDLLSTKDFCLKLEQLGYHQSKLVERVADYKMLEKVIDLCPPDSAPVRIEVSSGRIAALKNFDLKTQRGTANYEVVDILPAREIRPLAEDEIETLSSYLPNRQRSEFKNNPAYYPLAETLLAQAEQYHFFGEHLPADAEIIIIDPEECERQLQSSDNLIQKRFRQLPETNPPIELSKLYLSASEALEKLSKFKGIILDTALTNAEESQTIKIQDNLDFAPRFKNINLKNQQHPLIEISRELIAQKFYLVLVAESTLREERLVNLYKSAGLPIRVSGAYAVDNLKTAQVQIVRGELSQGFKIPEQNLVFISTLEIFGKKQSRSKNQETQAISLKKILSALSLISVNDLVVHENYGIGQYLGLKILTVAGQTAEFIQIQYADSKLMLPVSKIILLQKYSGPGENAPDLDRLGSKKWLQTKAKVYQSVSTLAGDLLKLYARRQQSKAESFPRTDALDAEFADLFPYDETSDQLEAIKATLEDLSSGKLCDRLICGDVGFGKTEVAMRAAFKAAAAGKQVAILAPTTLLVDQHFENFKERFASFPLKVSAVSRFFSARHNKQVLTELAQGQTDLVIGTHRLLQNDVSFKNLGLLIIDEEHRFGVKQKERFKMLKSNLHVLTLSATPIPRTLYGSLIKIRDISLISTAPQDRLSIKTILANDNDQLIRESIEKELNRQGQIFYLYNDIASMPTAFNRLKNLLPQARIICAHGKMPEAELEKLMHDFRERRYDVMLTTTIIESGIDLPNVNTLIIERADKFGLAQLYQLRGRVGRGHRQAYAIFLVPEIKKLSSDARERLAAIQSIDDLGQGFQLALRDLEIRGAGNLLGKEQSGNLFLVGFDLYMKLLNQAVLNLQGQPESVAIEPELKLRFPAYIPAEYIPDVSEKLLLYQRLALCHNFSAVNELNNEILDRYGGLPEELENYLQIMRIRIACQQLKINELEQRGEILLLKSNSTSGLFADGKKTISVKLPENSDNSAETMLNYMLEFLKKQVESLGMTK